MPPPPKNRSRREPGGQGALLPPRIAVPIRCQFCQGEELRRSRLRQYDLRQILFMRYPVRCLRCARRQLVSFTVAALSFSSSTSHGRRRRSSSSEKNWTEPAERMVLDPDDKKSVPEK
ncbi:MAG: hypothetical protein JSS95_14640 [Acidobacteria bacterium]|nr:hypothetical protein [Acidobacteriota bacterium]